MHLDASEIAVRGAFRTQAAVATLHDVRADGDVLRFRAGDDDVALWLGRAAARWATALRTPPPTLAAKLGIRPGTRVAVAGAVDEPTLRDALAGAEHAAHDDADVVIARLDDAAQLRTVLRTYARALERRVPIWIVYTKGRTAPLGESAVRGMMRDAGLIDVKVAAVSPALTALQFVRRAPA